MKLYKLFEAQLGLALLLEVASFHLMEQGLPQKIWALCLPWWFTVILLGSTKKIWLYSSFFAWMKEYTRIFTIIVEWMINKLYKMRAMKAYMDYIRILANLPKN